MLELASRAEVDDLSRLFQGFSRAFDDIVRSGQPRMALEMTLVRLARRPPLLPLDELLVACGRSRAAPRRQPPPRVRLPRGRGWRLPVAAGSSLTSSSISPAVVTTEPGIPRTRGALALVESPRIAAPEPPLPVPERRVDNGPVVVPIPIAVGPATDLDTWRAIVERVRETRPPLASVLEHALPLEIGATARRRRFRPERRLSRRSCQRARRARALDARGPRALRRADTGRARRSSANPPHGVLTVAAIDAEPPRRGARQGARGRRRLTPGPGGHPSVRRPASRRSKLPTGEG